MRSSGLRAVGALLILGLLAAAVAVRGSGSRPGSSLRVDDPYATGRGRWYRGQLHAHSNTHRFFVSQDSLKEKVERYRDAGYDFVCMTDHNFRSKILDRPHAALPTRDPRVPGILFISGAEIGFTLLPPPGGTRIRHKHHMGGIGMGWSVALGESLFQLVESDYATPQAAIDSIRMMRYAPDKEALAILNHPEMVARGDVSIYPHEMAPIRGQGGIEVYNTLWARARPGGKAWQNHGASHWDFMIRYLEGMRWGFATDDAHDYRVGLDYLGGWILVQAEELTTEAILDAIKAGRFVACVDSCHGAKRDTVSAVFTELGVQGPSLVAASDRPSEFTWWSDYGHLVRRREGVRADTFSLEGWERAVRVRIRNEAGAAYSQPFFVHGSRRDDDRWQLRPEKNTRLLLHFNEGSGNRVEDASGEGPPLTLSRPRIPPAPDWADLADTVVYRDSLWGGWLHNGVGTTPDETDLDRDRGGYAVRAHGRSLEGRLPVREGSPLLFEGALTLEWIGTITRRTDREQPLLVNETLAPDGSRTGWRVVVAETGAPESYRFRFYEASEEGRAHSVPIDGVVPGEVHLLAVTLEGTHRGSRVRVFRDGAEQGEANVAGARVAWRTRPQRGTEPGLALFADPFEPEREAFYHLRELRITEGIRPDDEIRADAERLGYTR
jgi:hypothetical protein